MRKLILKNSLSLGDIVMLTAAVRDLHRCCPGQFLTDVRTSCAALWENNPYLTPLSESDPEVEVVECHYPLIHRSNDTPFHCLNGFSQFLSRRLGVAITPTAFRGDIHLSPLEKSWMSQVQELTGRDLPFWIIVAGGKFDYTIKWWDPARYQQVVDAFRGRIQFVQVGEAGHFHPRLRGVIDLRGRTTVRQLVRLVYHAQGVLCGVTGLMHLAAAVETKPGQPPNRPCVVVAGGREPPQWEAYPHHQFIYNVGALPCCARGGCWRARTEPLGDGEPQDAPVNRCVDVVRGLPRCMDMIRAEDVIARIESYFEGGVIRPLSRAQASAGRRGAARSRRFREFDRCLNWFNAATALRKCLAALPPVPKTLRGRGLLICASGTDASERAAACLDQVRGTGCTLPAQLWLWEPDGRADRRSLDSLYAECITSRARGPRNPKPIRAGWELKAHALLECGFREALVVEAGGAPIGKPDRLFRLPGFRRTGAVLWRSPHARPLAASLRTLCGVSDGEWAGVHSRHLLFDVARCWRALCLWRWFNEHPYFFHPGAGGEAGVVQLALRTVGHPFHLTNCRAFVFPASAAPS